MDREIVIDDLQAELTETKKQLEKYKEDNKKLRKKKDEIEKERNQYLYEILEIRKSFTYKIGRFLTILPRKMKDCVYIAKKKLERQVCLQPRNEVISNLGQCIYIRCEKREGEFVGLIHRKDIRKKLIPAPILQCNIVQETQRHIYFSVERQSQDTIQAQEYFALWKSNGYQYVSPIKLEINGNGSLIADFDDWDEGMEVTFWLNNVSCGVFDNAELIRDTASVQLITLSRKQYGTVEEVVCRIPNSVVFQNNENWKFSISTFCDGNRLVSCTKVSEALVHKNVISTGNVGYKFTLVQSDEGASLKCTWRHDSFTEKNMQDNVDIDEFINQKELRIKGNIYGEYLQEDGTLKLAIYQELQNVFEARLVMYHTQGRGVLSSQFIELDELRSGKFEVLVPDIDWDLKFEKPINSIWFRVVLVAKDNNGIYCLDVKNFGLLDKNEEKTSVYDERESHLTAFGENSVCYINMTAVPYYANNKKLSMKFVRSEQLYRSQFTNELLDVKIKNDVMTVKMRCRDCGGKYLGTLMEYRKVKEDDAETYLIPYESLEEDGDFLVMTTRIDMKKYYMRMLYWDIRCAFEKDGKVYTVSCHSENKRFLNKYKGIFVDRTYPNDNSILFPYATANNSVALMHREICNQDHWDFRLKEKVAQIIYKTFKKYWDRKNIYLIFEKYCTMAQDNGYFFFKYCMDNGVESEFDGKILYVLDKNAADWEKIVPYQRNVLKYLSLKHMIYLQACKLMISTDTKGHAYVWRSMGSDIKALTYQKKLVFLQHGVTAFKRGHFERGTNVGCECFITTSQFEHDIIHNYLGYPEEEVPITGFSRWDVLRDKSEGHREILMMPTWRTWLDDAENEVFAESDYCKNYMALLNNPKLDQILKEYDVTLNFYLHPKFRKFITEFSVVSDHIRLIPFGEEPLNELMMECNLLITDFSSVAWDVYYMNKPVLFYHFDLDDAYKTLGFYMDMRNDIFGDRAEKPEELMTLIIEYIENGFEMKPQHAKDREKYFAFVDDKNSERIWKSICERKDFI